MFDHLHPDSIYGSFFKNRKNINPGAHITTENKKNISQPTLATMYPDIGGTAIRPTEVNDVSNANWVAVYFWLQTDINNTINAAVHNPAENWSERIVKAIIV